MPDPDYKALCAELIYELTRAANGLSNRTANDNHRALWAKDSCQAADRARAVLARCGNYPVKPDSSPATELSPAAQAVLDAATVPTGDFCLENVNEIAAAALRAVADQVVPKEPLCWGDQRWEWERDARQSCRKKMLAIADELKALPNE